MAGITQIAKILFFIFIASSSRGQSVHLGFRLQHTGNQVPVENASIILQPGPLHLTSDSNGYAAGHISSGRIHIEISHIRFKTRKINLIVQRDTVLDIQLTPNTYLLEESTITAQRRKGKSISGTMAGRIELNMKSLSVLPKFMGTNDPLKILQLMPGVQTSGDANAGLFIRGAEPGHNLVLWNDAPIYNPSHLLGFFSIFNSGHIGSFKLHKSNMEANYGGRLSSLLTVESPGDLPERTGVEGSVGLISSQASLALPLSERCGLYLSARKTYVGLLLQPLLEASIENKDKETPFSYEFEDANLTFIVRPSKRDKITLNAFGSYDAFHLEEPSYSLDGKMKWSNLLASLSWEHQWQERDQFRLSLYTARYRNKVHVKESGLSAALPSFIQDWGLRNEYLFRRRSVILKAGVEYLYHILSPQTPQIKNTPENLASLIPGQTYHTHELCGFLTGEIRLGRRLTLTPGLRYTANIQTGRFTDYRYNEYGEITDSVRYGKGEQVSFQGGFEPRLGIRYMLNAESALQLSYNRHKQYINLVSISGVGLPTDFWVPATGNIPAQSSHNYAIGYFRSFSQGQYELSTEFYFRQLSHQAEFNTALFDLFNQKYILEKSLLYGKGRSYGGELMLKKNYGQWNGWISYTLGWSRRYFPAINDGKGFPAKHDRRHDLSLTANYRLNKRWDFSTVFVYATGSAYTMPVGIYTVGGNIVKEYGKYNASRLPDYHRLDISANYWFFKTEKRESGLNFSIYNVYRRKNPLYVFVVAKAPQENSNQIHIKKKYKKLYDIVPSISWTFRF